MILIFFLIVPQNSAPFNLIFSTFEDFFKLLLSLPEPFFCSLEQKGLFVVIIRTKNNFTIHESSSFFFCAQRN